MAFQRGVINARETNTRAWLGPLKRHGRDLQVAARNVYDAASMTIRSESARRRPAWSGHWQRSRLLVARSYGRRIRPGPGRQGRGLSFPFHPLRFSSRRENPLIDFGHLRASFARCQFLGISARFCATGSIRARQPRKENKRLGIERLA